MSFDGGFGSFDLGDEKLDTFYFNLSCDFERIVDPTMTGKIWGPLVCAPLSQFSSNFIQYTTDTTEMSNLFLSQNFVNLGHTFLDFIFPQPKRLLTFDEMHPI